MCMFILGYNAFGGLKGFDTNLSRDTYEYLSLENGVYNEARIDRETSSIYAKPMRDWEETTVILGKFKDSLECGNLQQDGQQIQAIRFKKRPKGSLDWLFIEELPYSKEQNLYAVHDRLAYSQEEYEYCLTPVSNGVEGGIITDSIVCEFDGLWAVDRHESAKLFYNLEYGQIDNRRNIKTFETLDRRYPMIQSSATDYKIGSNSGVVVSQSTVNNTGRRGVDYLADRKEVDRIVNFLGNRKPKILKDGSGRQYLVMVSDIKEAPTQNFSGGYSMVNFTWTEIGDSLNLEDLITFDLLPEKLVGDSV